jgi:hypothetical protein
VGAELVETAKTPEMGDEIVDFHLIPTPYLSHPKTQWLSKLQTKSAALNFTSRPPPSRPGGSHSHQKYEEMKGAAESSRDMAFP